MRPEKTLSDPRGYYASLYDSDVDLQAEWLRRGASAKVDSIATLLDGVPVTTVVELGCGTGEVIQGCRDRGIGSVHYGFDFSQTAIEHIKARKPGIVAVQADVSTNAAMIDCDVVILSHVIEHLLEPAVLLRNIRRHMRYKYAIFEVPLEDLPVSRLKALFHDRTNNNAGHVQFYTEDSFEQLIRESGFEILKRRNYVPVLSSDTVDFVAAKDGYSDVRRVVRKITSCYLPRVFGPLWARYYYSHYAVLCQ